MLFCVHLCITGLYFCDISFYADHNIHFPIHSHAYLLSGENKPKYVRAQCNISTPLRKLFHSVDTFEKMFNPNVVLEFLET